MDIFADGLWAMAVFKAVNNYRRKHNKKHLRLSWAFFWGVFPDLFAFAPLFFYIVFNVIYGPLTFSMLERGPANAQTFSGFIGGLTSNLYKASHSIPIFILMFFLAWLILRRPFWEMLGWLVHIGVDMPSHSAGFYPTPFMWPLANWRINGLPWHEPMVLLATYIVLGLIYLYLFRQEIRSAFRQPPERPRDKN